VLHSHISCGVADPNVRDARRAARIRRTTLFRADTNIFSAHTNIFSRRSDEKSPCYILETLRQVQVFVDTNAAVVGPHHRVIAAQSR
jgi:hypothetical protein